ncbi:MAG: hypothetical protein H6Q51_2281 [Deltaproteobacteria bacterium]|nr:hypothetical protein [Deltaproteobacteria bacterium]
MLRLSQERHRDLKGIDVANVLHDQLVPKLPAGEAGRVEVVYQSHRQLAVEPPGDVLGEGRLRSHVDGQHVPRTDNVGVVGRNGGLRRLLLSRQGPHQGREAEHGATSMHRVMRTAM